MAGSSSSPDREAMSGLLRFAGAAALAAFAAAAAAQGQFIQSPPLARAVDDPVGSVAAGPGPGADHHLGRRHRHRLRQRQRQGHGARTASSASSACNLRLVREDVFAKQVDAYLAGRSPYLRGTLGMINMAAEVAVARPAHQARRHLPDDLVGRRRRAGGQAEASSPSRTCAARRSRCRRIGPHVDYLAKILADAGLTTRDVNVKWVPDLTGSEELARRGAARRQVDAALVIIPDALALTSNGTVGTGAEDSVKGARILLSTKTANRIIADVYAVRSDYFESNRAERRAFVRGLIEGETALRELVANKAVARGRLQATRWRPRRTMLLDSPQAIADTEGMYARCRVRAACRQRRVLHRRRRIRAASAALNKRDPAGVRRRSGLLPQAVALDHGQAGTTRKIGAGAGTSAAAAGGAALRLRARSRRIVAKRQSQGRLGEGELFSFEVQFKPNQDKFSGRALRRRLQEGGQPRGDLRRRGDHRRGPQRSDGVPAREEGRRGARSCSGARSRRPRT